MGVRLTNGRAFTEADNANTPKVAVLDADLAKRLWPDQNPSGSSSTRTILPKPVWRQVVGVVAPTRNRSLDIAARPSLYVPLSQGTGWVNFVNSEKPASTGRDHQVAQEHRLKCRSQPVCVFLLNQCHS